jgi:L-amino acid N-acyltransferase YncA
MPKTEILHDGTPILIREYVHADFEALMKFFGDLSLEDRRYLRVDVTNRKTMEQRIRLLDFGYHFRFVAMAEGEFVAEATLELPFEEWRRNQGEIRVVVGTPFQRRGLGMVLMKEMYCLALRKNVDTVVVWMMRPQVAAQNLCRKMGFRDVAVLPDYVKDQSGQMQDLVIMKGQIKNLMKEIEPYFGPIDWQTCI